jgi:hypothetical protein
MQSRLGVERVREQSARAVIERYTGLIARGFDA